MKLGFSVLVVLFIYSGGVIYHGKKLENFKNNANEK